MSSGLRADLTSGLTGEDFPDRTQHFGNNFKERKMVTSLIAHFWQSFRSDMTMSILCVTGVLSIITSIALTDDSSYKHGKLTLYIYFNFHVDWIWGGVIIVMALTSALVDALGSWSREKKSVAESIKINSNRIVRKYLKLIFSLVSCQTTGRVREDSLKLYACWRHYHYGIRDVYSC